MLTAIMQHIFHNNQQTGSQLPDGMCMLRRKLLSNYSDVWTIFSWTLPFCLLGYEIADYLIVKRNNGLFMSYISDFLDM